ncbi:MAG: aldo/keto reductase, partial [Candidatus Omnitrophica bacterium]|nr:aldo/keto reductase [Candidatus Omnitrophota bacterium]
MKMKYKKIPGTDVEVSEISLGTWVFGGALWGGSNEDECLGAVAAAADCGINLIDTAPFYGYGKSEKIVGKAIKGKRNQFVIATKCGLVGRGKDVTYNLTPESMRKELEESLRTLNVNCIDIYQCHWPDPNTPIEETLLALENFKKEGKIRFIGVSNFCAELLEEASEFAEINLLQSPYSLLNRSIEEEILPMARKRDVGVITYGSLGGGILSGKYQSESVFAKADVRKFFYDYYSGEAFKETKELLAVLEGFGHPLNQSAINWVRQQEGVISTIVGCRNAKQVQSNAHAITWELTPEQFASIEKYF